MSSCPRGAQQQPQNAAGSTRRTLRVQGGERWRRIGARDAHPEAKPAALLLGHPESLDACGMQRRCGWRVKQHSGRNTRPAPHAPPQRGAPARARVHHRHADARPQDAARCGAMHTPGCARARCACVCAVCAGPMSARGHVAPEARASASLASPEQDPRPAAAGHQWPARAPAGHGTHAQPPAAQRTPRRRGVRARQHTPPHLPLWRSAGRFHTTTAAVHYECSSVHSRNGSSVRARGSPAAAHSDRRHEPLVRPKPAGGRQPGPGLFPRPPRRMPRSCLSPRARPAGSALTQSRHLRHRRRWRIRRAAPRPPVHFRPWLRRPHAPPAPRQQPSAPCPPQRPPATTGSDRCIVVLRAPHSPASQSRARGGSAGRRGLPNPPKPPRARKPWCRRSRRSRHISRRCAPT